MKRHPITDMHLEDGLGSLPEHDQARLHCDQIEAGGDKERADELRGKLGIETAGELAEREAAEREVAERKEQIIIDLPGRFEALEKRVAELEKPKPEPSHGHADD